MRFGEGNYFDTESNIVRNMPKSNKSTLKTVEKLNNVDNKIINSDRFRADKLILRTTESSSTSPVKSIKKRLRLTFSHPK